MVSGLRGLLILAGLAGLLWPAPGFGQSAQPAETTGEAIPIVPRVLETPSPGTPPSSALPPFPDSYGPAAPPPSAPFAGNPQRAGGALATPGQAIGWYDDGYDSLIIPHIDSHLNSGGNIKTPFLTPSTPVGTVQTTVPPGSTGNVLAPFGNPITLPIAPLGLTDSPALRLGYRFGDGAGDVRLDWRMVATQGTDTIPQFDAAGAGALRSRLNLQYAAFTYGAGEYLTNAPAIDRTWTARFGVAAADVFFDSQARGQQILLQSASNSFAGVGPTVIFQIHKPIFHSRFSLFGDLDATGLVGFTRQHFSETAVIGGETLSDSVALRRQSNGVGIFGVEGGVAWDPWGDRTWRFTVGYQWQRWWWVGATSDSNAALTLQGVFLRGEWRY